MLNNYPVYNPGTLAVYHRKDKLTIRKQPWKALSDVMRMLRIKKGFSGTNGDKIYFSAIYLPQWHAITETSFFLLWILASLAIYFSVSATGKAVVLIHYRLLIYLQSTPYSVNVSVNVKAKVPSKKDSVRSHNYRLTKFKCVK